MKKFLTKTSPLQFEVLDAGLHTAKKMVVVSHGWMQAEFGGVWVFLPTRIQYAIGKAYTMPEGTHSVDMLIRKQETGP